MRTLGVIGYPGLDFCMKGHQAALNLAIKINFQAQNLLILSVTIKKKYDRENIQKLASRMPSNFL